jgi:hypothetical protein
MILRERSLLPSFRCSGVHRGGQMAPHELRSSR